MPHRAEPSTATAPASNEPAPRGPSAVGLRDAKLGGWYREDTGELFRGMPIGAGDVVVDVGCGAGVNSVFCARHGAYVRSEEHTSELQSLMRISYAVFCLKKKKKKLH